jgi:hypothetical protein
MQAMKHHIGLACTFHDPALAIVDEEGRLLFVEATERHTQCKHSLNIPADQRLWVKKIIETYCDPSAFTFPHHPPMTATPSAQPCSPSSTMPAAFPGG